MSKHLKLDARLGRFPDALRDGEISFDYFVTDPPYNIGFDYDGYPDDLSDEDYIELLASLSGERGAIIHYPSQMMQLVVPALGVPSDVNAWCYNSNLPQQFRLINYYGVLPDYRRIIQPYKNPDDVRIRKLLLNGKTGSPIYKWWNDIQQVKNVSLEKNGHPCPIPLRLAERIILLISNEGDTIFDPFMGGGTVAEACIRTGRNFVGIEQSPLYFEIAQNRIKSSLKQSSMYFTRSNFSPEEQVQQLGF